MHFLIKMVLFYCHISFWMFLGVYSFFCLTSKLANPRWWLDQLEVFQPNCSLRLCQNPRWLDKMIGQLQPNPRLGGGFKYFLFSPYLGKIPILTNIFQMVWNHQLEDDDWFLRLCPKCQNPIATRTQRLFFFAVFWWISVVVESIRLLDLHNILNIMCLFLPQSSKYLLRRFVRYVLGGLNASSQGVWKPRVNFAQISPISKLEMHLWSTFSQKHI